MRTIRVPGRPAPLTALALATLLLAACGSATHPAVASSPAAGGATAGLQQTAVTVAPAPGAK